MKAGTFVLLVLLFASVGAPGMLAADAVPHRSPRSGALPSRRSCSACPPNWNWIAISPTMMRIVLEEASRELGALDPREAAPLVLEEAVRAEPGRASALPCRA